MSVLSPIGCSSAAILDALQCARGGIRPWGDCFAGKVDCNDTVGLLAGQQPSDRTLKMALATATRAWKSAKLSDAPYAMGRIGLTAGASGAGLDHASAADLFSLCRQPQEQLTAIATALKILGPAAMFTSASSASGLALSHAVHLLRSGCCDAVLAGGTEALSDVNHAFMQAMRLIAPGACSPFSGEPGLTPGEGGAFFVLERLVDAQARHALIFAELYGVAGTQDGYDVVTGDPSGDGLARAMHEVLKECGLDAKEIDWIKANGTSNRDQDVAETLAIKQVFRSAPPVFAPESFVGHANGAAPAIGFALALIAYQNGLLPPTLNFSKARPGCDLDYVPNTPRCQHASSVLANSVGFGGSNVALVFGKPGLAPLRPPPTAELCITGIGVVSPFGCGEGSFIAGLQAGTPALRQAKRIGWDGYAGLIDDLPAHAFLSRPNLLQRYTLLAAHLGLTQAGISRDEFDSTRIGLFVGLTRASSAARNEYAAALSRNGEHRNLGKLVLRMARFTVASSLSREFKLQGYGATLAEGFGAGLHALAHACVHMQASSAQDAVVVIAGDELGTGTLQSLAEMNWMAKGHDGCFLRPYDPESSGVLLAEGAVAVVVERESSALRRGAKIAARIGAVSLKTGHGLLASAVSEVAPGPVDAAYGNGCGIWPHDQTEWNALHSALPQGTPVSCVNRGFGFAESASGLFSVAAAAHGIQSGEFFGLSGAVQHGKFTRQVITATTERNRHAAVLVCA